MTSYRRSIATMGLSRTVSKINGDFGQKSQIVPTPCNFVPPLKGFPLELGIGAGGRKTSDGATGQRKKFDDIFMQPCGYNTPTGRTDGQTPGYSKDSAYA